MTVETKTVSFSTKSPRVEYTYSVIDRSSYADYHNYLSFFKQEIDRKVAEVGIQRLKPIDLADKATKSFISLYNNYLIDTFSPPSDENIEEMKTNVLIESVERLIRIKKIEDDLLRLPISRIEEIFASLSLKR